MTPDPFANRFRVRIAWSDEVGSDIEGISPTVSRAATTNAIHLVGYTSQRVDYILMHAHLNFTRHSMMFDLVAVRARRKNEHDSIPSRAARTHDEPGHNFEARAHATVKRSICEEFLLREDCERNFTFVATPY